LPWRLQWLPVCASTERQLDQALAQGLAPPLAVIAAHQRHGHGQAGRQWVSPRGGVWLSAALPWAQPTGDAPLAAPALAVTLGLALQLEALGLKPAIKWPNDLLLQGRKLAGVLPRLRWRGGQLLGARVGVGLNLCNRVPPGAIALADQPLHLGLERGTALVLRALEWAVAASAQPELVRRQAERRLWKDGPVVVSGLAWDVAGLEGDGGLRLRRGDQHLVLRRRFSIG
jgi:BirA family biotin operon repressor/biotin-[acetyl-CoA-carboxylase] ligase